MPLETPHGLLRLTVLNHYNDVVGIKKKSAQDMPVSVFWDPDSIFRSELVGFCDFLR